MTMPVKPDYQGPGGPVWAHGVAEHNQHLRELAAERSCLLVDAERAFEAREELAAEFSDIVHLSPLGNRAKADLVADVLLERWIPELPPEGASRRARK